MQLHPRALSRSNQGDQFLQQLPWAQERRQCEDGLEAPVRMPRVHRRDLAARFCLLVATGLPRDGLKHGTCQRAHRAVQALGALRQWPLLDSSAVGAILQGTRGLAARVWDLLGEPRVHRHAHRWDEAKQRDKLHDSLRHGPRPGGYRQCCVAMCAAESCRGLKRQRLSAERSPHRGTNVAALAADQRVFLLRRNPFGWAP
mmetsp:Transcript_33466/g.85579  ORF Transcript_33466/g.85579 Transcript_33466/m.85579 type:complete len:201 (+) Transcript_33466:425-1027(+)